MVMLIGERGRNSTEPATIILIFDGTLLIPRPPADSISSFTVDSWLLEQNELGADLVPHGLPPFRISNQQPIACINTIRG